MHLIGIGIGPFNLSLAALLSPQKQLQARFFEARSDFSWHPGLMLPGSEIQVNYLKDLVTLVDPTNPYSFIAYLAKHKRLYRFINCDFSHVLRYEFNDYFHWVSQSVPNLQFNAPVKDITLDGAAFKVYTAEQTYSAQHIVLGTGLNPAVPPCARKFLGEKVFHSSEFLFHASAFKGRRIAIIGGGQSAAEIVMHLLNSDLPQSIHWISARNILPMDESSFVDEVFSPNFNRYFYQQTQEKRSRLLQETLLASDGVSPHLITQIYQRLYVLELQQAAHQFELLPGTRLINMKEETRGYELILANGELINADIVILCTGYEWGFPDYLGSLADRIPLENGRFIVNRDYSIQWGGPRENRIYVQNAAQQSHGVADRNLSLMAWRSAVIINSVAGKAVYDIENESTAIDWQNSMKGHNDWRIVCNA